ncbi:flagellar basal body L-ring protein FlgH [Rariglobus hedericola]|uniref:Flagellar basal body L-ring protein FlgH n=1 Tax=Rariglobus hedericola TaxID=2597822 RepID=A0A556QPR9_9BACT|nr:flagellar basal body L-ring protein FlgH [Rariglobus hedericola]TSJ78631.1 flagellar basal body L-ring protein FlgH [Rariglobus hedericola]
MKSFIIILVSTLLMGRLSADSLWTAPGSTERAITADRKAASVGDILTVVVQESASTQSSQRKKTDSAASVDAGVDQWLFPAAVSNLGTHNGALPGIKLGGKNDFSGGGEVSASQNVTSRAAVLVTAVLPNGNLVIEGARRVSFDGETQHVVLHGVVRGDDVNPGNTVLSSNIADARVEFISEGSLTDAKKKGWLTKLYEKLRPY